MMMRLQPLVLHLRNPQQLVYTSSKLIVVANMQIIILYLCSAFQKQVYKVLHRHIKRENTQNYYQLEEK